MFLLLLTHTLSWACKELEGDMEQKTHCFGNPIRYRG